MPKIPFEKDLRFVWLCTIGGLAIPLYFGAVAMHMYSANHTTYTLNYMLQGINFLAIAALFGLGQYRIIDITLRTRKHPSIAIRKITLNYAGVDMFLVWTHAVLIVLIGIIAADPDLPPEMFKNFTIALTAVNVPWLYMKATQFSEVLATGDTNDRCKERCLGAIRAMHAWGTINILFLLLVVFLNANANNPWGYKLDLDTTILVASAIRSGADIIACKSFYRRAAYNLMVGVQMK